MAFDIAVRTHDYAGNEDRTWLKTRKGFDTCRSITLDVSTFVAGHLTAKGAIPSGTVLAKITATGLFGPYDSGASDGRQLTTAAASVGLLFSTTVVGGGTQNDGLGSATDLTTAADVGAALLWEGVVSRAAAPVFAGTNAGELVVGGSTVEGAMPFIRFEA